MLGDLPPVPLHPHIVPAEHPHRDQQHRGIEHLLPRARHQPADLAGEDRHQHRAPKPAGNPPRHRAGPPGHAPAGRQHDALRPGRLQRDQLGVDGGVGALVAGEPGGILEAGAEHVAHAVDVVAAEIVVLVEDRDPRIRARRQDVLGVELRLDPVAGRQADGPGEFLVVAPFVGAGGRKEVRHLALVGVAQHGAVGRGAEIAEQAGDLVLLDQPADLLHRLRRAVGVVVGQELDLSPGDAALVVHHAEIGIHGLALDAERRDRPAVGHGVADADLGRGDARRRLGGSKARGGERGAGPHGQQAATGGHGVVSLGAGAVFGSPRLTRA